MRTPTSRFALILAVVLLQTACQRAVSFRPKDVSKLRLEGESAQVVYRDGHTLTVAEYDTLAVETRDGLTEVSQEGVHAFHGKGRYELDAPLTGALTAQRLVVRNDRRAGTFERGDVHEIELVEDAPERALIVSGIALGSAVLFGLIGSSAGSCNEEWGCYGKGVAVMIAVPIGFVVGLAVGIPVTSGLGIEKNAPPRKSSKRYR